MTASLRLQEIRRNPWPYALVAYFAVFITAMVTWAVFATAQRNDLVRTDYYEEELRHQAQMDRVSRSLANPAHIELASVSGAGSLVVRLPAAHAGRVTGGSIQLYRPSDSRMDRSVPLAADAAGVQSVPATGLAEGLWKVRVLWKVGQEEFFTDGSVVVGSTGS